jgi:hypothetical protein
VHAFCNVRVTVSLTCIRRYCGVLPQCGQVRTARRVVELLLHVEVGWTDVDQHGAHWRD